jgi:hypothetical protein
MIQNDTRRISLGKGKKLTKYRVSNNIKRNHSSRGKFGLARITFKKCNTLISRRWIVSHMGKRTEDGLDLTELIVY